MPFDFDDDLEQFMKAPLFEIEQEGLTSEYWINWASAFDDAKAKLFKLNKGF